MSTTNSSTNTSNENNNIVWYVTGASKGLGLELVKKLVQDGFKVVATTRSKQLLIDNLGEHYNTDQVLPLVVDLLNEDSIKQSISDSLAKFAKIDIVVNNAGYGLFGNFENITDEQARTQFDVNVFGVLNVIRNVLPHLRNNKTTEHGPHIFNISSITGFNGAFPNAGIYGATKFAVDGISQYLQTDLKPFGIHVTSVLPGVFKTEFLDPKSLVVAKDIPDYPSVQGFIDKFSELFQERTKVGDPSKFAALLISISKEKNPPLTLPVGPDSFGLFEKRIESVQKDIAQFKDQTTSTNFSN
ncbi:hypothetical protein CYY_005881 [Polysphondylium violaceum]|uniref:Short-chain dehydrogenase/reductase family protein n=1 Tax=Polysphondylium violaceum TaxID=133409 RepID=A0A8J4PSR5_9MYCE|nr:hypothetical protein CYY_005881 [Polysphondylium violaceum]